MKSLKAISEERDLEIKHCIDILGATELDPGWVAYIVMSGGPVQGNEKGKLQADIKEYPLFLKDKSTMLLV